MAKKANKEAMSRLVGKFRERTIDRYNESYLDFAIRYLGEVFSESQRCVMCRLMSRGLETDERYAPYASEIREAYDSFLKESEAGE